MSEYDLIIRNGTVVDGTGEPRKIADLGVTNGKIAAIGDLSAKDAGRVIDATGLIVAPGFIDLHTHYDAQLFWDPYCTISGWHGVTSVVIGNCGFGFAPCRVEDRERSMLAMTRNEQIDLEAMRQGMPWDWETFPEFLDSVERTPKGVNVLTFAPLTPIMIWAMGLQAAKSRRPNEEELKKIQGLIHEAMDHGAMGWSVQRLGENSVQPDYDGTPMVTDMMTDEEGYAFAEVLKERGEGIIQLTYAPIGKENLADSFMDTRVFEWEEKLAEISGRPIIHNIIAATAGMPQLHRTPIEWLKSCQERGLQIYGQGETNRNWQQFNFTTWNGFDIAPSWKAALMGSPAERLENLRKPEVREAMLAEKPIIDMLGVQGAPLEIYRLTGDGGKTELSPLIGKTVGEIAELRGNTPLEAFIDIAAESELMAEFMSPFVRAPSAEYTAEMIRSGVVMPGISDGGAHTKYFIGGTYTTDFLSWLVRDQGALTLEEAHAALSALPARIAGFKNRGTLVEGAAADIVVYDLANLKRTPENEYLTLHDLPGGDWRRVQKSEGYRYTIVNGEVTFEDGTATGAHSGKLLRHGA